MLSTSINFSERRPAPTYIFLWIALAPKHPIVRIVLRNHSLSEILPLCFLLNAFSDIHDSSKAESEWLVPFISEFFLFRALFITLGLDIGENDFDLFSPKISVSSNFSRSIRSWGLLPVALLPYLAELFVASSDLALHFSSACSSSSSKFPLPCMVADLDPVPSFTEFKFWLYIRFSEVMLDFRDDRCDWERRPNLGDSFLSLPVRDSRGEPKYEDVSEWLSKCKSVNSSLEILNWAEFVSDLLPYLVDPSLPILVSSVNSSFVKSPSEPPKGDGTLSTDFWYLAPLKTFVSNGGSFGGIAFIGVILLSTCLKKRIVDYRRNRLLH